MVSRLILTAAIENSRGPVPQGIGWAAATTTVIVLSNITTGNTALAINIKLVIIPVDNPVIAIISSPDSREFQTCIGAGRIKARPIEIRVRSRHPVSGNNLVILFNVPCVVSVGNRHVIHAGLRWVSIKNHHRLALATTRLGG
jgi:hypothetical protein